MTSTYNDILTRVAERTIDNREQLKKSTRQRRTKFSDLYGIEYLRQGDANNPATFYISISPDFVYYERFAFKFQIMPFVSSVRGVDFQNATIGTRNLQINNGSISPNPHDHPITISSTGADYGLHFISTSSTYWRVHIHGVDVTDYLIAQQDGEWIEGEGIYPNNRLEVMDDFYDILDVACLMNAEGRTADVNKLLAQELKKVEIFSDAPFQVSAMAYIKYSMVNR